MNEVRVDGATHSAPTVDSGDHGTGGRRVGDLLVTTMTQRPSPGREVNAPTDKIGKVIVPGVTTLVIMSIVLLAGAAVGDFTGPLFGCTLVVVALAWFGAIVYWAVQTIERHIDAKVDQVADGLNKKVTAEVRKTRINNLSAERQQSAQGLRSVN